VANHVAPFSCSSGSSERSLHDGLTGNTVLQLPEPCESQYTHFLEIAVFV